MVTPKPAWGAPILGDLTLYNPSKEILDRLITQIESITCKQATKSFRITISQLITLLRHSADAYQNSPDTDNTLKELEYVQKAMQENMRLFDTEEGINAKTSNYYTQEFIVRNLTDEKDPALNLYAISQTILEITASVKNRILAAKKDSPKNSINSPVNMRQIAAEELARAFENELALKPSKTRDGVFDQCFRLLFETVKCQIQGRKIEHSIPTDSFPIIQAAIDAYPEKPRYSLLLQEGEIYPGLTGVLPT